MTLPRRTLLRATGAVALLWMAAARAQKKLIRMIVPITPGTTPDLIARAIGPVMQARLDMNYVVENRAGASGMIGMDFVAKSTDTGTHHHLCMELLKQTVTIELEHIPYKGAAPAVNDLLTGQVLTMFLPIQVDAPQQRSGRLKIIGGSLRERHPGFPEIASLQEQGATGFEVDPWYAIWGAPKIPAALAEQYRLAIIAALEDPAVKDNLSKQGQILKWGTPGELLAMAKLESALWTRVVRQGHIKAE